MESDGIYYFNRCRRCNSLITKLQVIAALKVGGDVCECGSGMFGPTNPLRREWWTLPVLKMIVYKLLGWLTPAPEPSVMPHVPEVTGLMQKVTPLSKQERELLQ